MLLRTVVLGEGEKTKPNVRKWPKVPNPGDGGEGRIGNLQKINNA